jgi:hypothetical protein
MVRITWRVHVLAASSILCMGCKERPQSPPTPPPQAPVPNARTPLSNLPIKMTVGQRSTTEVPGSEGALRLTIGDITRGQVIVTLVDKQGEAELAATSLKPGDSASFDLGADTYQLKLSELNNALIGDDFATFTITRGANARANGGSANTLTEAEKIEQLLSEVETVKGDVFIRNGVEYSAKDAADHLRTKLQAAGDKIATAEEFIENVASASSLSGEPYRIRLANGTEVLAADYLREKLAQLEKPLASEEGEH